MVYRVADFHSAFFRAVQIAVLETSPVADTLTEATTAVSKGATSVLLRTAFFI